LVGGEENLHPIAEPVSDTGALAITTARARVLKKLRRKR